MSANPIARYYGLPRTRRALLLRAILTLALSSAAVSLLSFRRAIRFGSVSLVPRGLATADDIVWAIEAAARRVPWRTVCLQQGLAAQYMLRSAGIDALLHYGARHEPRSRDLEAHVWVTVDGAPVIGAKQALEFAKVATFP